MKNALPEKLTRSKSLLDFLYLNPSWHLEYCRGASSLDGWWWVRSSENTSRVVRVNGNAATAALKSLTRHDSRPGHALNETKWSARATIAPK